LKTGCGTGHMPLRLQPSAGLTRNSPRSRTGCRELKGDRLRRYRCPSIPSDYKVEYWADFGTEEPWVAWFMVGQPNMVNTVRALADTRDAFHATCTGDVIPALGKAFADLRRLRVVLAEQLPTIHVENAYETFYGHLWRAHKTSFQSAMKILGLDIGFLFKKDANFEKGAADLLDQRPELADLVELMRADRATYQSELGNYCDEVEHGGGTTMEVRARFHRLDSAETSFQNVRQAMQKYVTLFVDAALPPGLCIIEIPEAHRCIIEIPEAHRDPAAPVRFQVRPRAPLQTSH
jgi:hypothetical protein